MNVSSVGDDAPPSDASEEMQLRWFEEQKLRRGWIGVVLGERDQVAVYAFAIVILSIIGIFGFSVWQYPDTVPDTLVLLRHIFLFAVGFAGGAIRK